MLTALDQDFASQTNARNDIAQNALTIRVSSGTGVGRTRLSAFDAALHDAGVADYNLIRLSSVIPPGSRVIKIAGGEQLSGGHGDALYCVYADAYASTPGEQAWVGLAWSLRDDESGAGLFVEHHGSSKSTVERDLVTTLEDMSRTRGGCYHFAGSTMSSATCVDHPVSAVVVASYHLSPWNVR
ncbi:MAG TPA: pyruvoyl-dependent arginine decarboxylase [Propionibacteriaceae bacterium]|nr:pyruvoyl-dependent arginine decarboxylase [Propionibacteriaceae bacterium]